MTVSEPLFPGPRLTLRGMLRKLGASVLLGLGIGLLLWLGSLHGSPWPQTVFGGIAGFFIYATVEALHAVLAPGLVRLAGWRRHLGLGLLFGTAGVLGWLFAFWAAPWITFGWLRPGTPRLQAALVFAFSLALVAGIAAMSIERLRWRLQQSIAQLKEREHLERELDAARELLRRLLPPGRHASDGLRIAAFNRPARTVAGDFYDYFPRADGSWAIAVGDVAGKGMAASLLVASVKAMLPLVAAEGSPETVLTELNRRLHPQLGRREFVALALAVLSPDGRLRLANAGLPDPYQFLPGNMRVSPIEVPGPRLPLGARADVRYEAWSGELAPGEALLVTSDGLAEATLRSGVGALGYERLAELVATTPGPAEGWLERFLERQAAAVVDSPEDDATALLVLRAR
jgi:hypothetical protein